MGFPTEPFQEGRIEGEATTRIVKTKFGEEKFVIDDSDWSNRNAALLKALHNKDTCAELFRDLMYVLGEVDRKRVDFK